MATIFESPNQLIGAVGRHLGYSEWLEIRQERIDRFAEATGDRQWIHVDPERAATGPFGRCIVGLFAGLEPSDVYLPPTTCHSGGNENQHGPY